jgi:hypothetical protein
VVADDPESISELREAALESERQRRRVPTLLMRWMMKSAAKKSRLVRALFDSDTTSLEGISTYVIKLGAGNLLPPYDSPIDRKSSTSAHVTLMRLRMQQMAKLIAANAGRELPLPGRRPLHFSDIGGGPAMDVINALILLSPKCSCSTSRLVRSMR